ncbi:uncharacterized protein EI90DRAFT_2224599 [Cantharellus anzutake]|uniref:uncharacterized protein n=1 Tax=Cantharellus anzutake TaxID=1750568 RepID=UPI001907D106|nr:uncharacterized protein EI90DRAFT_2224599 [Cantharellus anzutake]KAF8324923.1 hypothetical protein EI90DRAFT_2224599 [Cantharellus anzutake]
MQRWCLLVDHKNRPAGEPIQVGVSSETNVANLKKMVKDEMSPLLADAAAAELKVWRCTDSTINFLDVSSEVLEERVRMAFVDNKVQLLHVGQTVATLISDNEVFLVGGPVNRAPDPTQLLSLNCLVLKVDGEPNQIFTVKILKTENVSTLKRLIKEEQSPRLNHVVASELILSQVCRRVDDDPHESLKDVDLTPLKPLLPLSQVFPRVEGDHLHIVVQAPTDGEPISVFLHVNLIDFVQRA